MKTKNYILLLLLIFLSNSIFSQVKEQEIISKTKKGIPKLIRFEKTKVSSDKKSVTSFLKKQFEADPNIEFKPSKIKGKERNGFLSQKYNQYYNGIKVEFARINTISKNGSLHQVNGSYIDVKELSITPNINEKSAIEYAKKHINADKYMWENIDNETFIKQLKKNNSATYFPKAELVIIRENILDELSQPVLAYKIKICAELPFSKDNVYVNANTGEIIYKSSLLSHVEGTAQTRYSGTRAIETEQVGSQFRLRDYSRGNGIETFNMNNGSNYGAATDYLDNDNNWTALEYNNANNDNAALDAHWGTMMVYDYFFQNHNLDSYNGNSAVLQSFVNTDLVGLNLGFTNNDNAFWDGGDHIMTYGSGTSFDPVISLDIIAHEIGHGIDQFSSNLEYIDESGALDEGIADVWGSMVELFAAPEKNTYLLGEDVISGGVRSLSNPKAFNNPDTYLGINWYIGSLDRGGVHTNSGVLGHWFYLLAQGSSTTDEINDNNDTFSFSGIGSDKAANILFHAQQNYFTDPLMGYITASDLTIQAAKDLYGNSSNEAFITQYAWYAVGIGNKPIQFNSHYIRGPRQITPGTGGFYTLNPYANATNYVWVIPSGCTHHYCWEIVQGQGTNSALIHGGLTGVFVIICKIYNGSSQIAQQRITVNVQDPYNGGGSNNTDDCVDLPMINGVIYPPADCPDNENSFVGVSTYFKQIIIYDLTGRKVYEKKNIDNFDISSFSNGIYILKVELNNNKIITKKILR